METRDSYLERLDREVRQWAVVLDALQTRIDRMPASESAALQEEARVARVKCATVEEGIRALRGTGDEVWETLRPGTEAALEEVTQNILALGAQLR